MNIIKSVNGKSFELFDPDMSTFRETFPNEEYEPGVCDYLASAIESADSFLDIGSLYGYFSLYTRCLNSKIPVYAFEPNKYYFQVLKHNIDKSNFGTINCLNFGLGENTGTYGISQKEMGEYYQKSDGKRTYEYDLKYFERRTHRSSPRNIFDWILEEVKYRIFEKKPKPHAIDIVKFDEWIEEYNYKDIVAKIDIHGAEAIALRGMKRSIENRRFSRILLEVHKPSILLTSSYKEIFNFFDRRKYRVSEVLNFRKSTHYLSNLNDEDIENFCNYKTWNLNQKLGMRMLLIDRI